MLRNWKTTLAGAGAIMVAAGHLLVNISNGDFSSVMLDSSAISMGLGLLFAKDHNVTGV